jgi:hypothetical protein
MQEYDTLRALIAIDLADKPQAILRGDRKLPRSRSCPALHLQTLSRSLRSITAPRSNIAANRWVFCKADNDGEQFPPPECVAERKYHGRQPDIAAASLRTKPSNPFSAEAAQAA